MSAAELVSAEPWFTSGVTPHGTAWYARKELNA